MQVEEFLERQLLNVSKPSWYTGGEFGSVEKDKNKVDIRYAFCFPDLYDVPFGNQNFICTLKPQGRHLV